MMRSPPKAQEAYGFTLVEVMITVVIVGILSAIALPNYFRQVQRTKQNEAASTLAQFQTTAATYLDEFNLLPGSWAHLNDVAVIMTDNGTATAGDFSAITLPGGQYSVSRTNAANNYYEFTATSTNDNASEYNVIACVCLSTGASDLKKGTIDNSEGQVTAANLVCKPCPA
ncbi:type IV pilin protein [Prochlorococcus sp. MIT 1303]|uniref:type IV pilin protein n=1 Tax=Prochlorococcus sp. MIT 1303 TaxID=1723647 RepID=UPI0007B3C62D|nr:prepilin-type N-terminal cleavage/methylation domain-containing protein [Prochlorococcus sp. MIT 1303]KZR65751.1 Fimbrial protein precursor [Prochlorococcus sp. MIT 1303]